MIIILANVWRMKRGRGRPRKTSLNSGQTNNENYLEDGKSSWSWPAIFFRSVGSAFISNWLQ